jgi:hypothetical protein
LPALLLSLCCIASQVKSAAHGAAEEVYGLASTYCSVCIRGLTVLPALLLPAVPQVKSAAQGAADEVEDEAKEHRTGLYTGGAAAASIN